MKSIKTFFTVLLCLAIICVLSISELLYCAHTTLMSPSHFSKFLDKDRNLSKLTELVYSSLAEPISESSSQVVSKYAINIFNQLDRNLVKGQIYILAVGLQKYIAADNAALPTLDFMPINAVIKETLISDIMKQPTSIENVNKVKSVLSVISNKYFGPIIKYGLTNQLITALLKLDPIQNTGFNGTTISKIIEIYLSLSNENISIDEASYNIVVQLVEKGLELDQLKAYFDVDLFLEKAFGNDNPILAMKVFINRADASTSLFMQVLFWCLIFLLFVNLRFSLLKFLRLILYCISMAAIFNLMLSVLLINPNFSRQLLSPFSATQNNFGGFLIKLCVFLFGDFGINLAMQSIAISFFAVIAYLITASLLKKSSKTKISESKTITSTSPLISRFTIIIVAFLLLFSWWNYYSINKEIKLLHSSMQKLKGIDMNQSIIMGLREAGGMEFLEHYQKK